MSDSFLSFNSSKVSSLNSELRSLRFHDASELPPSKIRDLKKQFYMVASAKYVDANPGITTKEARDGFKSTIFCPEFDFWLNCKCFVLWDKEEKQLSLSAERENLVKLNFQLCESYQTDKTNELDGSKTKTNQVKAGSSEQSSNSSVPTCISTTDVEYNPDFELGSNVEPSESSVQSNQVDSVDKLSKPSETADKPTKSATPTGKITELAGLVQQQPLNADKQSKPVETADKPTKSATPTDQVKPTSSKQSSVPTGKSANLVDNADKLSKPVETADKPTKSATPTGKITELAGLVQQQPLNNLETELNKTSQELKTKDQQLHALKKQFNQKETELNNKETELKKLTENFKKEIDDIKLNAKSQLKTKQEQLSEKEREIDGLKEKMKNESEYSVLNDETSDDIVCLTNKSSECPCNNCDGSGHIDPKHKRHNVFKFCPKNPTNARMIKFVAEYKNTIEKLQKKIEDLNLSIKVKDLVISKEYLYVEDIEIEALKEKLSLKDNECEKLCEQIKDLIDEKVDLVEENITLKRQIKNHENKKEVSFIKPSSPIFSGTIADSDVKIGIYRSKGARNGRDVFKGPQEGLYLINPGNTKHYITGVERANIIYS